MIARPWSTTSPSERFDYIVIGSGMGGITCAAALAKLGRRVLVLEQHYTPGGMMHRFTRGRWAWDVGLHLVGEVTRKDELGRLLHWLTDGRLDWTSVGPVYDRYHWPDGFSFAYPDSPEAYRAALLEAFPSERAGIDRWFRLVASSYQPLMLFLKSRALPRPLERPAQWWGEGLVRQRAADVFASITDDPRLRAVLAGQWFYWGTPPSRSSVAVNLLAARMFQWGGYYPVGGPVAVVRELLRTVSDGGGWTRIRADVTGIVVDRGRAVGVRVRGRRGAVDEEISGGAVISAAGAIPTVTRLLPQDCRQTDWARRIARLEPNQAHVGLFLGLEGDVRAAGASPASIGVYDGWDIEATWDVHPDGRVGRVPFLWCGFGSLKDPERPPSELHTAEVMAFLPWDIVARWDGTRPGHRGDGYQQLKEQLGAAMLGQLLERLPGLRPLIRHVELSTPLSTDHFARPIRGSIYGLHATTERLLTNELRARTPIKNLYLAGNDVALSGIAGAALGGVLAAVAAEPWRSRALLGAMR